MKIMKRLFRKGDLVKAANGRIMEIRGFRQDGKVEVSWFDAIRREVYLRIINPGGLSRV